MKWLYGGSWEKFPIDEDQVWKVDGTESAVCVHNIFNPLPAFMKTADMIFVDPPWNLSNVNTFYTKAEISEKVKKFELFEEAVFSAIKDISPETCYIEIGFQNARKWQDILAGMYKFIQSWEVVYYRKHPCVIIRGSNSGNTPKDYSGKDEEKITYDICSSESYSTVADFCMGRGNVGVGAFRAGKNFVGTELNKRRLAVLLERITKEGGHVSRVV